MKELVFLLEEPSAKAMLESLLPRILQADIRFRCIAFEGKQDLEAQLLRKVRAYQNPLARFIVMRDQDNNPNCVAIKRNLAAICQLSDKGDKCMVRIACRELESFYLADLASVERALNLTGIAKKQNSKKYRSPDYLGSPSMELRRLTQGVYQKVSGSSAIGKHLSVNNDRSRSYANLIRAIKRLENELVELNS